MGKQRHGPLKISQGKSMSCKKTGRHWRLKGIAKCIAKLTSSNITSALRQPKMYKPMNSGQEEKINKNKYKKSFFSKTDQFGHRFEFRAWDPTTCKFHTF